MHAFEGIPRPGPLLHCCAVRLHRAQTRRLKKGGLRGEPAEAAALSRGQSRKGARHGAKPGGASSDLLPVTRHAVLAPDNQGYPALRQSFAPLARGVYRSSSVNFGWQGKTSKSPTTPGFGRHEKRALILHHRGPRRVRREAKGVGNGGVPHNRGLPA